MSESNVVPCSSMRTFFSNKHNVKCTCLLNSVLGVEVFKANKLEVGGMVLMMWARGAFHTARV